MDELTHGSLFSGIGGFDLGFERAGFKTIWQVEIDDYASKVLTLRFHESKRFRDIKECGSKNLEPVDVISGGFPCQDISDAGKKEGITGSRSGLWTEYLRIIGELRPRFVVVENVAALYHRGLGAVLGGLASRGYDAEWDCIPAAAFGAPHLRERIWIVAYRQSMRGSESKPVSRIFAGEIQPDANGSGENVADTKSQRPLSAGFQPRKQRDARRGRPFNGGSQVSYSESKRRTGGNLQTDPRNESEDFQIWNQGRGETIQRLRFWSVEPDVGRVAHGVPSRVDRLRSLGNSVVPQITEWIAWKIRACIESGHAC